MKYTIIALAILSSCAKVPDYVAPPLEIDASASLVSETVLSEKGCQFQETIDNQTVLACEKQASIEDFYDQRIALRQYEQASTEAIHDSGFFNIQNKTTKIAIVAKNFATDRALAVDTFKAESAPSVQDEVRDRFYSGLLRLVIYQGVFVNFDRNSVSPTWSISLEQARVNGAAKFEILEMEKFLKARQVPSSSFMFAVLNELKGGAKL